MSPEPTSEIPTIAVIDTSVLIEFKSAVGINDQWDLLVEMSARVVGGSLVFPRQVAKELSGVRHPDTPGAWIASARRSVRHPEPSDDTLVTVLAAAPDLIEADNPNDPADPYVVAMAIELSRRHPTSQVVVVTNDTVDRLPVKLSLATACLRVDVVSCRLEPFVAWLRGSARNPLGPAEDPTPT